MELPPDNDRSADRRREGRWLAVCVVMALGAFAFAALVGPWWGDVLAFLVAVAVGWIAHVQWGEALADDMRRRRARSR